ncbi:hypothetical protein Tco_0011482 [Tanacetum coccineum]
MSRIVRLMSVLIPGTPAPGEKELAIYVSTPGSLQLPRPEGTRDALFNQCRLVYLDIAAFLRTHITAFSWSYLLIAIDFSNLKTWSFAPRGGAKEHKRRSAARGVAPVWLDVSSGWSRFQLLSEPPHSVNNVKWL